MEGRLEQSPHYTKHIPRGELVELLSKALLYVEVEAHWKGDAMTTNCKTGFSLLESHICSLEPKVKPAHPPLRSAAREKEPEPVPKTNGDAGSKRKADAPSTDNGHAEKRAKRSPEDMDVDLAIPLSERRYSNALHLPIVFHTTLVIALKLPVKGPKINHNNGKNSADFHAVRLLSAHKSEVCAVFVVSFT